MSAAGLYLGGMSGSGDFRDTAFHGIPGGARVAVAMSGGVDSSAVAALTREQGFDTVGVTLQLYDHGAAIARKGACCAGKDIYDARQVAEKIGIPHYVLDYESRFSQTVMDDFADSYLAGETPVPCIKCNQTVKFTDLLQVARDLGAALDFLLARKGQGPVRIGFEGIGIKMGGNITVQARIGVMFPGAADVVRFFIDRKSVV